MLKIDITVLSGFIRYFGNKKIEEKAKDTGFIKRNDGKLKPDTFIKTFVIGLWGENNVTLQKATGKFEDIQYGLFYSKQALYQKLKSGAAFLKEMFKLAMEVSVQKASVACNLGLSPSFKNIYVCDATLLKFPQKLINEFGELGSKSAEKYAYLKLQTLYNVTTRTFRDIQIFKTTESDKKYLADIINIIKKGDLIVYDLGFFSSELMKKISSKGGYYLSKIRNNTKFYKNMEASDRKSLQLEKLLNSDTGFVDKIICIGEKRSRIQVRLVAAKLPESVVNERLRKAYKRTQKKELNEYQKTLLSWNINITNAPQDMLSLEDAMNLYKIRWQIEIMFKAWKSHLRIDNTGMGGKDFQECLLYGRLIAVTLITLIYSKFYQLLFDRSRQEVSILRFFSQIQSRTSAILQSLTLGSRARILDTFAQIASYSIYEKRKRKTTLQLFSYEATDYPTKVNYG